MEIENNLLSQLDQQEIRYNSRLKAKFTNSEEEQQRIVKSVKGPQDETLDEEFVCKICQQLVFDPKECKSCDEMSCKKCLNEWF